MTKCNAKIRFENDLKLLEICLCLIQSLALMVKDTLYFLLTKKVFTSVNNAIGLNLKKVFICQAL